MKTLLGTMSTTLPSQKKKKVWLYLKSFSRPLRFVPFRCAASSCFWIQHCVLCERPLRTAKKRENSTKESSYFLRSASGQNQSQKSVFLHTRKRSSPDIYICKRSHLSLSLAGAQRMSHVYRAPWVPKKKGKMWLTLNSNNHNNKKKVQWELRAARSPFISAP